jgi:hypothetical protein
MNDQLVLSSTSEFTESKVVGSTPLNACCGGVQPHPAGYQCSDRNDTSTRWLLLNPFKDLGKERRNVDCDLMKTQMPNFQNNIFFIVYIIPYLSKTTYNQPIHRRKPNEC